MVPFSQVRPIPIYSSKRLKCVLNFLSNFRPLLLRSWWFAQDIRLEIAQQKQPCPPLQKGIIFDPLVIGPDISDFFVKQMPAGLLRNAFLEFSQQRRLFSWRPTFPFKGPPIDLARVVTFNMSAPCCHVYLPPWATCQASRFYSFSMALQLPKFNRGHSKGSMETPEFAEVLEGNCPQDTINLLEPGARAVAFPISQPVPHQVAPDAFIHTRGQKAIFEAVAQTV